MNLRSYQHMIDFVQERVHRQNRVLPTTEEIQLLEVFKKLIESGWIVTRAEVK